MSGVRMYRPIMARFDGASSPEGSCRIGLAHGSVANRLPEKGEAGHEIADDSADRAGLAYLALGDWHGALNIAPRTWYSGAPEPDRHKANDSGNVQLVTLEGPGAPGRVAAVGNRAEADFRTEAAALRIAPVEIGTVTGLNYTRGR